MDYGVVLMHGQNMVDNNYVSCIQKYMDLIQLFVDFIMYMEHIKLNQEHMQQY